MFTKQHLTPSGFSTILSYYASINRGMSAIVSAAFPDIIGVQKDKVILPDNLDPHWVSGFIAGDGGFYIGIRPKIGQIYFRFHITQHSRDINLMVLFVKFFNCGKVNIRSNTNRCDYYVQDFLQIYDSIIPHFDNYPLYNIKSLDLADFKKAAELFKANGRKNIEAIKEIISNMNSKREE
uniref:LAGLIDADG endonuclease n=1 Tax=Sphaerobolus stellatus TaxID=68786 RepID=A0A7D4VED1_9AGAM|nr:LAGLIDADG endonuclease [Sphaerobolus stellatus]